MHIAQNALLLAPFDTAAPHPTSKAKPGHPTVETHFSCLNLWSRSFRRYRKFMTKDELGLDIDGLVGLGPRLPSQIPLDHNSTQHLKHLVHLTLNFMLPRDQDPKILEIFGLGQYTSPTRGGNPP